MGGINSKEKGFHVNQSSLELYTYLYDKYLVKVYKKNLLILKIWLE